MPTEAAHRPRGQEPVVQSQQQRCVESGPRMGGSTGYGGKRSGGSWAVCPRGNWTLLLAHCSHNQDLSSYKYGDACLQKRPTSVFPALTSPLHSTFVYPTQ